ncbi:unnamed protein product [Tuber melanosporum]|uniref:Solute carrier family 40 member n=1 Tax=Tuber melanosporum (strain Mel28) TaxID=656061 RepID=D5GAJ6_TUBMM|nr:uncharacterized protein GSTUM_00003615001 [Tuber melanosporum]CAZ81539.1 unnamed protein product [Tuber melanosporum]
MGSGISEDTRSGTELLLPAAPPPPLPPRHLPKNITLRLYLSHLLSTWNSRVFEFGALLFIANLHPDTLLPGSLYALVRGVSAVLCSPWVGRHVDSGDRLRVVRVSIVAQRVAVVLSCGGLLVVKNGVGAAGKGAGGALVMGVLAVLACCEKLASVGNLIAVERDWVVLIAGGDEGALLVLNSQMRRIDLFCKLLGPLAVSAADGISTVVAIYVVLGLNLASVGVECFAIADVYRMVPALQEPKTHPTSASAPLEDQERIETLPQPHSYLRSIYTPISKYLHHSAALPSLALSIVYFTVLNFGAQMITYLLASGYTPLHISSVRGISVLFEISATWLAPLVMSRVGPIRGCLWSVNWQLLCVAGGVSTVWFSEDPKMAAGGLILGVIFSRIGLWGFDLFVQIIIQDEVEPGYRGSFSATEASVQNTFELGSYAMTAIFARPAEFRYLAVVSAVAVLLAAGLFAGFVRKRRGHLVHTPACFGMMEVKRRAEGYQRLAS